MKITFVRAAVVQLIAFLLFITCFIVLLLINRNSLKSYMQRDQLIGPYVRQKEELVSHTNIKDSEVLDKIRTSTKCKDSRLIPRIQKIGKYWYFENYIRAEKTFRCHESITLATHSDYISLFHLFPLLSRWNGPISVAVHAPGADFYKTMDTIHFMRKCHKFSARIRQLVTFHIYSNERFIAPNIPTNGERWSYPCTDHPPYSNKTQADLERIRLKLSYPVNIGRNLARKRVPTHFVLSSEIDFYPSPDLIDQFLFMASEESNLIESPKNVFALPIFEMKAAPVMLPATKLELYKLYKKKVVFPFNYEICSSCHKIPYFDQWINTTKINKLSIFASVKREKKFNHWEPFFIGTKEDPTFDERLSWGRADRTTQSYAMCVLNYKFHILNSVFMLRNPRRIFEVETDPIGQSKNDKLFKNVIAQVQAEFGTRQECEM